MIGEEVIAVYGDAGDGEELFEVQKLVRCEECMFADVDAEAEMARCSLVSFPLWHRCDYFCADGEREGE